MIAAFEGVRRQGAAGGVGERLRQAQVRITLAGILDKAFLQLEPASILGPAGNLENEPRAAVVLQQKITVPLSGKRGGPGLDSPQFARDCRGLLGVCLRARGQRIDGEGHLAVGHGFRHQRSRSRSSPNLPR